MDVSNFEILEYIPLGIFIVRRDFVVLFWNSHMEEWTGVKRESIVGTRLFDHFPGMLSPVYVNRLNTIFSGGPPIIFSSQLHRHLIRSPLPGGRLRIQHTTVVALHASGEDYNALFAIQDVTDMTQRLHNYRKLHEHALEEIAEREKAEKALLREKEQLAVTLRSIGDGVITTDTGGKIVLMNRVAENLTGWSFEDAVGKDLPEVFRIINRETRMRCEHPVEKILSAGQIAFLDKDSVLLGKDGVERAIADRGAAIRDNDGQVLGAVIVFQDITEKLKMEEDLLKWQKIESVGTLAAGIAHDFNNLLTAILGNISLAKAYVPPDDAVFTRLVKAEEASLRAKDLTKQLLTFSKGGAPIKKAINIAEIIKAAAGFALSGSNNRCEVSSHADLWPVEADEGQLGHAFNNLIINADQATANGGTIRISMENSTVGSGEVPSVRGGRYCKIAIHDQGAGIRQEHLKLIFDPYFTTKENGKGLGLFTAYSIIKKHDGNIFVESCEGKGTTFTIFLPASGRYIAELVDEKPEPVAEIAKILVMDDEEVIRELAGEVLKYLGYEVVFARDGVEAIELFCRARDAARPFAAVILDLTIPGGMGGRETVARMLKIDPSVKAVVASGYSNDPIMSDYRTYGFSNCIPKPYTVNELGKVLDDILN